MCSVHSWCLPSYSHAVFLVGCFTIESLSSIISLPRKMIFLASVVQNQSPFFPSNLKRKFHPSLESLLKLLRVWNELLHLAALFAVPVIILFSFSVSKDLKHPYLSSCFREEFLSQQTHSEERDKREET